jgi:hypothetical protein
MLALFSHMLKLNKRKSVISETITGSLEIPTEISANSTVKRGIMKKSALLKKVPKYRNADIFVIG